MIYFLTNYTWRKLYDDLSNEEKAHVEDENPHKIWLHYFADCEFLLKNTSGITQIELNDLWGNSELNIPVSYERKKINCCKRCFETRKQLGSSFENYKDSHSALPRSIADDIISQINEGIDIDDLPFSP